MHALWAEDIPQDGVAGVATRGIPNPNRKLTAIIALTTQTRTLLLTPIGTPTVRLTRTLNPSLTLTLTPTLVLTRT